MDAHKITSNLPHWFKNHPSRLWWRSLPHNHTKKSQRRWTERLKKWMRSRTASSTCRLQTQPIQTVYLLRLDIHVHLPAVRIVSRSELARLVRDTSTLSQIWIQIRRAVSSIRQSRLNQILESGPVVVKASPRITTASAKPQMPWAALTAKSNEETAKCKKG